MLHATAVKCPECGATLAVPEGAATSHCTYCGTESRVQRRTQFFQLPVQLPPAHANAPLRIAQQPRTRGAWLLVVVLTVFVVVPIGGLVALLVRNSIAGSKPDWWSRGAPLAADVDGDGIDDFIGWNRSINPDAMKLAAFSGSDGHSLWTTAALGNYSNEQAAAIVAVGKLVLVGDAGMRLAAFDLATGSAAWSTTAAEGVDLICDGDATHARMMTKDNKVWAVALDSGVIQPSHDAGRCKWGDFRDADAATHLRLPGQVEGMSIMSRLEFADGGMIGLGIKSPGSAIPMIAMFEPGDKLAWTGPVPGHDPLTTSFSTSYSAATDREVVVAYARQDKARPEVTMFDRATGKRRWETAIDKTMMDVLSGVTITRSTVAVALWGALAVFDRETGAPRFVVGG